MIADSIIKKIDANLEAERLAMESLKSELGLVHSQLKMKDDEIKCLMISRERSEKEKRDLELSKDELASKLASSIQEMRTLEGFVHLFSEQMVALNGQSLAFSDKFDQLNLRYESHLKVAEEKMDFTVKLAQKRYDQLQEKLFCMRAEKDALHLANEELNDKVTKMKKDHESSAAQLSEENHVSGERIKRLETEVKTLVSKKMEAEALIARLEENIISLSETARSSENTTV